MSPKFMKITPVTRAAILLTLVAALGFLAGIAVDRLLIERAANTVEPTWTRPRPQSGWMRRPGPGPRYADQLARDLDLSPEQKAEIERILADQREETQALMNEFHPRFRALVGETRRRIDAVLTPEQRARLDEIQRERAQRPRPGPRPGPRQRPARPSQPAPPG